MSTIHRSQIEPARQQPPRTAAAVTVSWSVDRLAIDRARPGLLGEPPAGARRTAVLLRIEVRGGALTAELDDPATGRTHQIETGQTATRAAERGGYLHVRSADAATGRRLFDATLPANPNARDRADGYAWTALLGRLGVPGGRYSRPVFGR